MIKKHLEDKFSPPYLDVDKDSSDWRQKERNQIEKTIEQKLFEKDMETFLDLYEENLEDNNK